MPGGVLLSRRRDEPESPAEPLPDAPPTSRPGSHFIVSDSSGSHGADYLGAKAFPEGSADASGPPLSESEGFPPDAPVHALPETHGPRKGPFGVSTALHILVLALLIYSSLSVRQESPAPSPLTFSFQEPEPSPKRPPLAPVPKAPSSPRSAKPEPKKPAPPPERELVMPPSPPKLPPPATPLPPPKRMGEMVPVPHYPVPGSVPPEKPPPKGASTTPETAPAAKLPGSETGTNETDLGAGDRTGPGAGGGKAVGSGLGAVPGGRKGGLSVPRLGGGALDLSKGGPSGGGKRRGLNMELPPDVGGLMDFEFDDKDYDWADYQSQMYWAIWRSWMNRLHMSEPAFDRFAVRERSGICSIDSPAAGKACKFPNDPLCGHLPIYNEPAHMVAGFTPGNCVVRLQGTTVVRFVIERSGTISTISILDSSTIPPLDDAAEDGLKEAPLPRLPEDFDKNSEGVTARFIVDVPYGPDFKEYMSELKRRGIF